MRGPSTSALLCRLLSAAALAATVACEEQVFDLQLFWPDAEAAQQTSQVQVLALESGEISCGALVDGTARPEDQTVYSQLLIDPGGGDAATLSDVPSGPVLFVAIGRSDQGGVIVRGCTKSEVRSDQSLTVIIRLEWVCHPNPSGEIPGNDVDDDCDELVDECPDNTMCDAGSPDASGTDAGASDGAGMDSAGDDAAATDAARPDRLYGDASGTDSALPDLGPRDLPAPDLAIPDGSLPDFAAPDTAGTDTSGSDASCPPQGAFNIEADASHTNVTGVVLNFSWACADQVYVTNTPGCGDGGVWQDAVAAIGWTLAQTNGTATVYAMFGDRGSGATSACISDSIVHDDEPPLVSFSAPAPYSLVTPANQDAFTISGTCSDHGLPVFLTGPSMSSTLCDANLWSTVLDLSSAPEGDLTVTATQIDQALNNGSDARTFIKSTTADLIVLPTYPVNGRDWNEYVLDDGPGRWNGSDSPCEGPSTAACLNAGVMRRVDVPGYNDCRDLSLADSLGAFRWICRLDAGDAAFFSEGFRIGKGLADLVDANGWRDNSVVLSVSGIETLFSASGAWWTNPVVPLPPASGGDVTVTSQTHAPGTVFTVSSSGTSDGHTIELEGASVVTLAGVTLSSSSTATNNCDLEYTGLNACLLFLNNVRFTWLEGDFDAANETDYCVYLERSHHNRLHQVNCRQTWEHVMALVDSDRNALSVVEVTDAINDDGLVLWKSSYNELVAVGAHDNNSNGIRLTTDANYNSLTNCAADLNGGSGAGGDGLALVGASSNTVEHFDARQNARHGLSITGSVADPATSNVLHDLELNDQGGGGLQLHDTLGNQIDQVRINNSGGYGVRLEQESKVNSLSNLILVQNSGNAIELDASSLNRIEGLTAVKNQGRAIRLDNGANANILSDARAWQNIGGIDVSYSFSNAFSWMLLTHNEGNPIELLLSDGNVFAGISLIRNQNFGALVRGCSRNTFHQLVVAGASSSAFDMSGGANNTISQAAIAHSWNALWFGSYPLGGDDTRYHRFAGNIVLGIDDQMGDNHCDGTDFVEPGLTWSGATCIADGITDPATVMVYIFSDLSLSFAGPTADSTNASGDGAGEATASTISDWLHFDNPFRSWGHDSTDFDAFEARGTCTAAELCQIWDWRLKEDLSNRLHNRSGLAASPNQPLAPASLCPPAAAGSAYVQDLRHGEVSGDAIGNDDDLCEPGETCDGDYYLLSALEVVGDAIGDDDGLCESNEACLYAPNIGAYQGEGDYSGLSCAYNADGGPVTGVTMYGYPVNGQ